MAQGRERRTDNWRGEDAIKGIDEVAQGQDVEDTMVVDTDPAPNESGEPEAEGSYIDAVIICHEFADHMHKETLLEISPTVPIFATAKAFSAIRS
jgi:L-ascorbate metabolism protein UlaG (beta-lactamase superfamily)